MVIGWIGKAHGLTFFFFLVIGVIGFVLCFLWVGLGRFFFFFFWWVLGVIGFVLHFLWVGLDRHLLGWAGLVFVMAVLFFFFFFLKF